MADFVFTTGSTLLPDVGTLRYNSCTFSPLFESKLTGNAILDEAKRTVKYTEITLVVDGYVTLQEGADISPTMTTLHDLLIAQGGDLTYEGRGFDIVVNAKGAAAGKGDGLDLAWGPVPKLIEFQPMGGGLSAKVRWQVVVHIYPQKVGKPFPLLQFNYETSVTYGEDCYSTLSMRGTLEIPLTRFPSQTTRTIPFTADDYREEIQRRLMRGIDLSRFRVVHREFPVSRDKRTLTWDVLVEEKPYMDLPPNCPIARGSFDVRPARTGPALILWLCTLRVTYTIRPDVNRRQAYTLFLALMRLRMAQSVRGNIPKQKDGNQQGGGGAGFIAGAAAAGGVVGGLPGAAAAGAGATLGVLIRKGLDLIWTPPPAKKEVEDVRNAVFLDFSISEGIYLDSKTITFSCTWRICTTFSHILLASGTWRRLRPVNDKGENLWALSMRNIQGATSYYRNRLDPKLDVIVDFGSTE